MMAVMVGLLYSVIFVLLPIFYFFLKKLIWISREEDKTKITPKKNQKLKKGARKEDEVHALGLK